jgi:hypothetical protein
MITLSWRLSRETCLLTYMGLYESLDSIHILYSFFTNSFQTDIRRYGWTDEISDFLGQCIAADEKC